MEQGAERMSPGESPSQPRSAGYGRACRNCYGAKCRCEMMAAGGPCMRCERLRKDCEPMHSLRKAAARKGSGSRTAQLEDKLDTLVSILRSSQELQQQPCHSPHDPPMQYLRNSSDRIQSTSLDSPIHSITAERDRRCRHDPQARTSPTANVLRPRFGLWPQEADDLLAKFRTWLPNLPFMYIPPFMTAVTFRAERPFLWLCITSFICSTGSQTEYLRDRVRNEISERIIMNHERSMDLLLGLVAYLGWASLSSAPGAKPFIVLYTHLASLMVNELGLLQLENEEHRSIVGWKSWKNSPFIPKARTMEEMRAILAVWLLSSLANTFTARVETPRWEFALDECLELVGRSEDLAQDQMLVRLVKIQRVTDEAHRYIMYDLMPARESENKAPTYFHKSSLLEQLKAVLNEMPAQYTSNSLVILQTVAAEAHVQAIGLLSKNNMSDAQSVQSMYSCVTCIKTAYDTFFSISLTDVPGLPFYVYITVSSLRLILYRLTVAHKTSWDKEFIRSTADVIGIIDRTIMVFEKVGQIYPSQHQEVHGNFFQNGARFMRNLRLTWLPEVERQYASLPTPNSQHNMGHAAPDVVAIPGTSIDASQPSTDLHNDDLWIPDMLGLWQM